MAVAENLPPIPAAGHIPVSCHRRRAVVYSTITGLASMGGDQVWHWLAQRALDQWFEHWRAGMEALVCLHVLPLGG